MTPIDADGLLPFDPRLTFAQRLKKASGNSKLVGLTLPQKQVCKDLMKYRDSTRLRLRELRAADSDRSF